ncbi:MAG: Ig-like domain-containing protein, partial [Burkholderiaceae bacterium]|nr:Ig-like domain-containing protein [Burkholderiaceae bacterium]
MNNVEKWVSGSQWSGALILAALAGCGGSVDPILGAGVVVPLVSPTVTAVAPVANAAGVPINTKLITAAFSAAMDPATLNTASFTLACAASAGAAPVSITGGGPVTYSAAGKIATLP